MQLIVPMAQPYKVVGGLGTFGQCLFEYYTSSLASIGLNSLETINFQTLVSDRTMPFVNNNKLMYNELFI